MPITTTPVVNNFGIISHAQQADLTEMLFKKAEEIKASKSVKACSSRNPFEITEDFVKKFNNAQSSGGQDQSGHLAKQLLSRSKRRAGLSSSSEGNHVELPLAWVEFMLLALCSGKILNDSLDCLLESLNQAPVCGEQVPVLFYLAESVLYWVTTNSAQKPQLYGCEVKMLKVGYLVFLRLFLSHISGNLSRYQKRKCDLHHYLKALAQYDSCHQPHPDILFNVHFMLRTGTVLCGTGPVNSDSVLSHADLRGYEMNQVLWHCLLSWYCVQNNIRQLPQVLHHLVLLRHDLLHHSWVDCGLGLMVLGEAAKSSLLCLHVLLDLPLNHRQDLSDPGREGMSQSLSWSWQLDHIYTTMLAEICQHGCIGEIRKTALVGKQMYNRQNTFSSGGLLSLLKHAHRADWRVRYSAVRALVNVCEGLRGDWSTEGLRNVAWLALQEHLAKETDSRVTEASRVSKAEGFGPKNMSRGGGVKIPSSLPVTSSPNRLITWQLALTLSQLYLPPVPLPPPPSDKLKKGAPPHPVIPNQEALNPLRLNKSKVPPPRAKNINSKQTATHDTLRQQNSVGTATLGTFIDINTRAKADLMTIVEDQWQKERRKKMAEEEEAEKGDRERQRRDEEDDLREILAKRKEKVQRNTKPYELPGSKTLYGNPDGGK